MQTNTRRTRIYLLRHGETVNHHGVFKFNGQNDVDITREGESQLSSQAEKLKKKPIKAVYSSDLIRAIKGAKKIASALNLDVAKDSRLREIHAGRWQALSREEVMNQYPGELEKRLGDIVHYQIPGGGENLLDVQKRAGEAMAEILQRHQGEEVVIVAHGGTNRVILSDAMGLGLKHILRIDQDFGGMNIVDFYDSTAVVKLLNLQP